MSGTNTLNDTIPNDRNNAYLVNHYDNTPPVLNGNDWDVVYSFFKKAMKDEKSAEEFALAIYQIGKDTNTSPLEIISTMKGKDGLELSSILSYYMNGIRSTSTLLGVTNNQKGNFYAVRQVVI